MVILSAQRTCFFSIGARSTLDESIMTPAAARVLVGATPHVSMRYTCVAQLRTEEVRQ